jgi:hypothetical protein
MSRLLQRSVTLEFVFVYFIQSSELIATASFNSIKQLTSVKVKCSVIFAVRIEFLNVI